MQKNLLIPALITSICWISCQSNSSQQHSASEDSSTVVTAAAAPSANDSINQLSPDEQSGGWSLLFNGQTLDGWRGYQNKPITAWEAAEGTIHCNGNKKDAPAVDLITDKEYQNFELSIDWKIAPASNSGIMFHVDEKNDATYDSGPEYQIIDDEGWPGKLEDWQHTGCNYAMQVPAHRSVNPVGQWNHTKIVVNNAHVEHWLNGEKILEYDLWSLEWKKQKAAGKWKDVADYGMARTGHIALQYHGGDVWFRNIKLKQL